MAEANQYFNIDAEITDLAMVQWPYTDHDDQSVRPVVYFDQPAQVDGDVWIGMLDKELTEWILDATEPRGRNYHAYRAYSGGYAFIRSGAPEPKLDEGDFDPDLRLRTAITFSRLVHPTAAGLVHAVRIRTFSGARDKWQIGPRAVTRRSCSTRTTTG